MDIAKKEKLFNIILENLNEGIHVVDEKGKTIIYNTKMSKIEGMDKNRVKGENLLDIFPSLDNKKSTLMRVLYNGKSIKNEEQLYLNKDGKTIATINCSIPIKFDDGTTWALEIARNITDIQKLNNRISQLQKELDKNDNKEGYYTFVDIIGENERIKKLKKQAMQAAKTNSSILIVGDTGTGKELFAQSIHCESKRRNKPFITQNCAALPANLLEGILFGTRKGGFTGAMDREGLFEQADGGTLLLDEINSMSLNLQAKLLRVLEEGLIRPVGSKEYIKVDVRIIATINTPPVEAIRNNELRDDLYYRLAVVLLYLPVLCERKDDIIPLTNNFIRKFNCKFNLNVCKISEEVKDIFYNYSWPGNIRQLKHVIEGVMNLIGNEKVIKKQHIEPFLINISKGSRAEESNRDNDDKNSDNHIEEKTLPEKLSKIEKEIIIKTLEKTRGNVSEAAKELGIKRQSLQYRMEKYGIK